MTSPKEIEKHTNEAKKMMQKGGEDFMQKYEEYQKDKGDAYLDDPVEKKEEDAPDDEYSGK